MAELAALGLGEASLLFTPDPSPGPDPDPSPGPDLDQVTPMPPSSPASIEMSEPFDGRGIGSGLQERLALLPKGVESD